MTEGTDSSTGVEELIRLELAGKDEATGRYDEIIWRIRTGYVVILYGAIGLFLGKRVRPEEFTADILLLISGFSFLAYFMDFTYRVRQLRVVVARNRLMDLALQLAAGTAVDVTKVRELLHISGESPTRLGRASLLRAATLIFLFYAATPILGLVLRSWR